MLKSLLWAAGAYHLRRRVRHRRTLTVVMYHRVLPRAEPALAFAERWHCTVTDELARCIAFFRDHYAVVSLRDVEAAARGERRLPDFALLITFDGGWRDNLEFAEPVLATHGVRGAMFVNVDAVDDPHTRWWQDALVEARTRPPAPGEPLRFVTHAMNLDDEIAGSAARIADPAVLGRIHLPPSACASPRALGEYLWAYDT